MLGWSLLTDFGVIKRAREPILRSLIITYRLQQQAFTLRVVISWYHIRFSDYCCDF